MGEQTTTVDGESGEQQTDEELLDRFEERYQTEQVLNSSSGVAATITHAGWRDGANDEYVGAICLSLSVPGGSDYPIVVPRLAGGEPGEDFLSLLHWLELSPERDLSTLDGEQVAIDLMSAGGEEYVRIATGNGTLHGRVVDDERLVTNAAESVPETVCDVLRRVHQYRRDGADGTSVRIVDLSATEEQLVLGLEGSWGTIRVPAQRAYQETPQTPYEQLVELVGGGSVKQIEGGSIHLVHESDVPHSLGTPFAELSDDERRDVYDGYLTSTSDFAGEWALFLGEPDHNIDAAIDLSVAVAVLLTVLILLLGAIFGSVLLMLVGVGSLYLTIRTMS